MLETQLKVARRDAESWGVNWLENTLSDVAAHLKRELKNKNGDDQGDWRVWTLGVGTSAASRVARETFASKRAWVRVSRGAVLVSALGPADWLRIEGHVERSYDQALRREAQKLSEQLAFWWAQSGRRRLVVRFDEIDGGPWRLEDRDEDLVVEARVDLAAVRGSAAKPEVEALAASHLDAVVRRVGELIHVEPHY